MNDLVLDSAEDSPSVLMAKRWLNAEDVPEPDVSALAYTVNAYNRRGSFEAGANEWVKERLRLLTREQASPLPTQELLDLLFLFHRKERFCEGTLSALADEIGVILNVLRQRVQELRSEGRKDERNR